MCIHTYIYIYMYIFVSCDRKQGRRATSSPAAPGYPGTPGGGCRLSYSPNQPMSSSRSHSPS